MPKLDLRTARRMKNSIGEIRGLKVPGLVWRRPTLASHYGTGSGKIEFHMKRSTYDLNQGRVTGFKNMGGSGSMLDSANMDIALENNLLMFNGSGYITLRNPINIFNARLMWVMSCIGAVNNNILFGDSNHGIRYNSLQPNGSTFFNSLKRINNTNTGIYPSPRVVLPLALAVVELDMSEAGQTYYLNGVQVSTGTAFHNEFLVQRIGHGLAGTILTSQIGEVLTVRHGGNASAAIVAARQYLASQYNIVIS